MWSLYIVADKQIKKDDVEEVLDNAIFVGDHWKTMGVMVQLPQGKTLCLTGSWHDVQCAKPAARMIKAGLQRRGYKVLAGKVEG